MRRQIVYSRPRVDEGNLQPTEECFISQYTRTARDGDRAEYIYVYTGGLPALFSR